MRVKEPFILLLALSFAGLFLVVNDGAGATIIQDAVDNANPGDTVQVSTGTYFGKIVINKPLHLVGDSRDTTTIDGQGCGLTTCSSPVILVTSNDVEIRGLYIRRSDIYAQGVLVKDVTHVNITNTIISATVEGDGVTLSNANNSIITDNIFRGNLYAVNATNSFSNLIARNTATSFSVGVQLWNSENNIVANNTFTGGESGVDLILARQNLVIRNLLKRNNITGIQIEQSPNNEVLENSFQLNRFGINLQNSQGNTFYHNNVISSSLFQVNHVNPADKPLNTWNNGTAGNYWDDYQGLDDGSNNRSPGDGIGDTAIPHLEVDNYPLTAPFVPIPLVVKALLASPAKGPAPLTVTFSAQVLGGKTPYLYSWSFGDGSGSTQPSPSHTFESPGSFTAQVTVSDSTGASDVFSASVLVEQAVPMESPSLVWWVGGGLAVGGAVLVVSLLLLRRRRRNPLSPRRARK